MKAKTRLLTLILPSLMLAGTSAASIAADKADKPYPDQGTTMEQPSKAGTDQGAQPSVPAKPASEGTAQSNQPKPSTDASAQMKTLDTDNDGTVDKAEAGKMKGLSDHFDMADKNKDGKLDAAELATAVSMIKK
jgi:EF hand